MRIRPATLDDAPAVAAVHVASWQGAYRGVLPDDVLDGLRLEARTAGWRRQLTGEGQFTFVAEDGDGRITGFAHGNAAREDNPDGKTGEVFAIYASPDAWGTGAGRELMAAAVEWLRNAGFREAVLWVLESNEPARRFYERAGFAPDGTAKDDVMPGTPIHEVRYRRPL